MYGVGWGKGGMALERAVLGAQIKRLSCWGGGSHALSAPEKHVAVAVLYLMCPRGAR